MTSGKLEINEYGPDENVVGYIQPKGKHPKWILWHYKDGHAELYTERKKSGAVAGDPIVLK